METRSLLGQIIGCSMPYGFLIILVVAAHVDGQVTATSSTWPAGTTSFSLVPGLTTERVATERTTAHSPGKPSALPLSQSTAAAKKLLLKPSVTTPLFLLQDSTTAEPETIRTKVSGVHPSTNPMFRPTTEAAIVGEKFDNTSGVANPLNATTAPLKTAFGNSSVLKPRSNSKGTTKGETQPSLTPEEDVPDDTKTTGDRTQPPTPWSSTKTAVPQSPGPGVHQQPSATTAISQAPGTGPNPRASPARKSNTGIIVAAVICALLLLILLIAVLYCRRRRRSGSTSFNGGWAGQVPLPDDSGLDRDVEQGAVPAKEEEGKRNTLITFSGKRQSKLPSVAMEEIGGKEEREENQKLLCGDTGEGSSPDTSGQANGKLPEPAMQSSQEIVFPPPPANQE